MNRNGFSLLEVMIALAIMAISFTSLLATQSGHIFLSERGDYMSTAVMLARQKLTDIEIQFRYKGVPRDEFEETKAIKDKPFGDDFPNFGYQLSVRKVSIPIPSSLAGGEEIDPMVSQSSSAISNFLSQAIRETRLRIFWESPAGEDGFEIVTHFVDLNTNVGIQ